MPSWPHHIAVYGPPGSGKSAVVKAAKDRGFPARDPEQAGRDYAERRAWLASLGPTAPSTLFGAADLTPEDFPAHTRFVLLAPSPNELERRVRGRGDQRAHKWVAHALQVRKEHLEMARNGVFDMVLEDDGPPEHVLAAIVSRFVEAPRPGSPAR